MSRPGNPGALDHGAVARLPPHPLERSDAESASPVITQIPSATYRLQLNSEFTLAQAARIIGYLDLLGVSHCYLSPLAQARAGSPHGYDVTDHQKLNPELGGIEAFREFAAIARRFSIGIIVDTVPNHMCIADPSNRWWYDVLENGPSSPFASFFDIDWHPPKADLANKVLLPVLGEQFGRALENGSISIAYSNGAFEAAYYDHVFPLAPRTWTVILDPALVRVTADLGESSRETLELASIITALHHLPLRTETDVGKVRERQREKEIVKERLCALTEASATVQSAIAASIAEINGTRGDPQSFDRLEMLLDDQAYRLSFWHVAADEINYRRFFDVNDLAAIRVEEPEVFRATHELILGLIREGLVSGLRIDHVDGLRDPGRYLRMLQHESMVALGGRDEHSADGKSLQARTVASLPLYIVVEKILGRDESLRRDWPVHGTTGYEFLNALNGLFVDGRNCGRLMSFYVRFTRHRREFPEIVYDCKKLVLRALMSGEQNVLARKLDRISEQHRWSRDFTLNSLGRVLAEVIACFPVYRSYVTSEGRVSDEDRREVTTAISGAKRRNPALSESPFDFLASVLLLEHPEGLNEAAREERLDFTLRFQQLTSPVMAKGFEDTALYRLFPLASLNEVGGEPTSSGTSIADFNTQNERRLEYWPHALCATATHDTKRGEDVRARINVLSEIPEAWEQAVRRWHRLNAPLRVQCEGIGVPDANEEYLFYQTLVGTWPLKEMKVDEHARFVTRIQDYMHKSSKEAKFRTSWVSPNSAHDDALIKFVASALRSDLSNPFLADFIAFHKPIATAGMLNSLSQALIKATSPGVPDFYQGTELWDDSLVDPDNRRAVDFAARQAMLEEIICEADRDPRGLVERCLRNPQDGRIKLYAIHRMLRFRRNHRELFAAGAYLPLSTTGMRARHVIAFARRLAPHEVLIAAGRFFSSLGVTENWPLPGEIWSETKLVLSPESRSRRYVDLFTGRSIEARSEQGTAWLPLDGVFAAMPISMLVPSN